MPARCLGRLAGGGDKAGACMNGAGRGFARRELGRMRAYRLERSDDDDGAGVGDDPVATTEGAPTASSRGGP